MSEMCEYCGKEPAIEGGLCAGCQAEHDHIDELMAEFEERSRGPIVERPEPECGVDAASGPPVQLEMEGV